MPHELEYIVKDALMMCDKGAMPAPFSPTYNTSVKISGCLVSTKADKIPGTNIPPFGACSVTGSACSAAPIDWLDTYKVKVKGQETILFKSKLPCSVGGKIEFVTSGQVPIPPEEMDALLEEHGQEEEDDGWGWWDTAELIPVVGNIIGMVREGQKGNWGMFALNAAFLVVDVFTLGSGSLITAPLKGGIKAGVKITAKSAAKSVAKSAAKLGTKAGLKGVGKGFAKAAAKKVDDLAIKYGKVCVFACFPAGTKIAVKDGHKNIEDIKKGELVWAYNEETTESELKPVLNTMQKEADTTIELTLGQEIIETTAEHPFYTRSGWKDAADLDTKDEVKKKDGTWHRIEATNFLYSKKKVYNFEVADLHTYFVGAWEWLVHNAKACITGVIKKISKRLKYMGRTPGKGSRTGREVFERMTKKGTARTRKDKFGKEIKEFWDKGNKQWRNIKEADMGHKKDAVTWWNKKGRKFGAKSKEVRDWMLDSKNYELEYFKTNRSRGSILGQKQTYKPPLK